MYILKALTRLTGHLERELLRIRDFRWLALEIILLMWILNFSWESIVMPRSHTWSTWVSLCLSRQKLLGNLWGPTMSMLHLVYEIRNCHSEDQACMMSSWLWRMEGDTLENDVYSLISSANSLAVADASRLSVTSLMKTLKRRGPSTLPWGTPLHDYGTRWR